MLLNEFRSSVVVHSESAPGEAESLSSLQRKKSPRVLFSALKTSL